MARVDINGNVVEFPDELTPEQLQTAVASAAAQLSPPQPAQSPGMLRRGAEAVVRSPALPIIGGTVGGIVGAPTGPGAIPLAGLGAGGGEAIRQLAARGLGMDAPKTSLGALKKIVAQGAVGAAGEGAGQGLRAIAAVPQLAAAGRGIRSFFSATTGVPEAGFKAVAKKPSLILTASKKAIDKTGQKIGEIVDKTITKDMSAGDAAVNSVERAFATDAAKRNAAKKVALKFARGEPVSNSEVALANRAINAPISNAHGEAKALLQQQKEVFQKHLAKNLPELKNLNAKYAELKSAGSFRNIGRLNKSGEPSRLGAMLLSGAAMKSPLVALTSPALVGAATAAGSATAKAAGSRPVLQTITELTVEKAKDFLRRAKGNKEKAREMATAAGWKIPE